MRGRQENATSHDHPRECSEARSRGGWRQKGGWKGRGKGREERSTRGDRVPIELGAVPWHKELLRSDVEGLKVFLHVGGVNHANNALLEEIDNCPGRRAATEHLKKRKERLGMQPPPVDHAQ